jgi:type IV pilus assembly protein PilC
MLTYDYVAHNPTTGEKIKAQVEAEDESSAASLIRKQGLTPIDIKPNSRTTGFSKYLNKVKTKDKILFSRQLATLLGAGLPLVQALHSTQDQTASKPLKTVIGSLISNIEAGTTLSAALAKNPKVFNTIFINLVAAGEASGTLDKALERLASQQEKDADIISKVRGAFAYPVIVLVVMFLVVGFMIVKVLPAVGSLYNSLPGVQLPLITRILLSVSHFGTKYWWIVLLIIAALVFLTGRWARTLGGKSIIDKAKMVLWPIGPLFMKVYMARFARTASTLISSGVPIIQVLEITAGSINNVHITASLKRAIEKVKGGKALSDAISKDPNFLPLVPNMLRIGEQSGTIEQMMERVAEYYEKEVDNEIKTVSTLMEPILMIILGIMAFIIVAAVLLPIYSLAGNSSLTSAF